ncbi:TonB-dependent receptor [Sphingobacterium detergens]|uniref:TonB-linked SusC/RagA family outer membrane protein n=1 Tax=Sphingobacterium detergens TaxID=1145106 RepID=A0A420AQK8_SPHD1|nr:TonB-dependent receptor [Sphingobacterium detergens]RKE46705.1 TonB-linked SusC/RagA family outer membrane protein [Sphingobacterium detergens]
MIFIQKNDYGNLVVRPKLKRWVLKMKLTILFTVLSILKLSATGFAQNVSLKAINSPLIEVMQNLQKQSGLPFLLNGKDIANTKINADLKNVSLEKALNIIFFNKSISWEVSDGTIVLQRSEKLDSGISVRKTENIQQSRTIQGKVTDERGNPLVGVSVRVKGTNTGVATNNEGNYSIAVSGSKLILQFSIVGFFGQEVQVTDQQSVNVIMKETFDDLEEVVVIGYGTQKKKLSTGATVQVKGEDLEKLSTPSILEALQSQSPGVQITQNSGMPGESFKVTIRGLGTINNSSPLYVIDGIAGGDINLLNPSDIESIDILKDAASAAIYGSRAANGVVLITTKQGKVGKMMFNLDSYTGFQNIYRKPSLLNAKEYMLIQDERRFNESGSGFDWANLIPKQYQQIMDGKWNGTNWLEEIENKNALLHNTSLNLTGGNEQSKFSLGYSITKRDGVLGKPVEPHLERHTFRLNSDHIFLKNDRFNVIKFGENVNYSFNKKSGIGIGNIYWNDVHNMLVGNPLLPVYNENGGYYDFNSKVADKWAFDAATLNPVADMFYRRGHNLSKSHALSANAYLEIQPIEGLIFKTNFGYRLNASSYRSYVPVFKLSTTSENPTDDINQNQSMGHNWVWENTLSYKLNYRNNHQLDVVLGQTLEKWGMGETVGAQSSNSIFPGQWDKAWVGNGQLLEGFPVSGNAWGQGSLASFFGRANYNFKETYMASFTMRADGSSNFAKGKRWGYFPSASLGWVMTNEEFLKNQDSWLNFLKIRGSWGQNGNASIPNFQYLSTIAIDNFGGYYFGNNKNTLIKGAYPDILPNPDVTWETSEQLNLGFDSRFVNNRLAIVFDWYKKSTIDWLIRAPILASYGTGAPFINGGDVNNTGVELGINWNDQKGDFRYGIGINGAYNKNKVVRIANREGIIHGRPDVLSQGTLPMYRAQVGFPIGYFYGYQTEGVFQNQAQIDALRNSGRGVLSNAQPGDLIFADMNGDGAITDDDKVMIGNPHPKFTGGLNLTFGYKGLDLAVTAIGSFGHQIAKSYRSFSDSPLQNYTTEVFQRWHGEGTSNRYPRLTAGSHSNFQNISDIYIENGDFVKLQNITMGYNFKSLWKKAPFSQARIYATVQNLVTFTNYSGMDPEIGYGDTESWVSGIDVGFYPQPRTILLGLNLKF